MTEEREQGGAQQTTAPGSENQGEHQEEKHHHHEARHDDRHERRYPDRGPRRDHRDGHRRHDKRPGRYRPSGVGGFERTEDDARINEIIRETEQKLQDSTQPVQLANLNAFERKQIHRHFERRRPAFETKTYRVDDESHVLWVFPVANLKKFVEAQAKQAIETDSEVALPPMSSYERFLAHEVLKDVESVESISVGEGAERHIQIQPKKFGRGLKKIIKKIKLM